MQVHTTNVIPGSALHFQGVNLKRFDWSNGLDTALYKHISLFFFIRWHTCVNDFIDVIKKGIQGWAGHLTRFKENRWTIRVTEWTPREWTRRQGRPKKHDGQTTSSETWVLRGQEQQETGVCGDSSGRGSSLRSERYPSGRL